MSTIHLPPTHQQSSTVYIQSSSNNNIYRKATVITPPHDEDTGTYIVQMQQTGEIREVNPQHLFNHNPATTPTDSAQPLNNLLPWIKHNSKVTINLQRHFSTPKQGYLTHNTNTDEWYFIPGRHKSKEPIKATER